MKIMKKHYIVNTWNGEVHFLTANELYEKVMKDSKSNYNWIASASELVRICSQKSFPEEYAINIKIAILNCFAKLELVSEDEFRILDKDYEAVRFCYNSLNEVDEKTVTAKQNYLMAIVKAVAFNHYKIPIHYGKTYFKKCSDWINSKFEENMNKKEIDFTFFIKYLNNDFETMIKNAEKEGAFEEEDSAYYSNMVERCVKLIKFTRGD